MQDISESQDLATRADAEFAQSIDRIMRADDRLAAARAETARQAAEIAVLRISRDGFRAGQAEMARRLQAEQRKTASLQQKLDAVRAEVESLRERVRILGRSA